MAVVSGMHGGCWSRYHSIVVEVHRQIQKKTAPTLVVGLLQVEVPRVYPH